MITNSLFYSAYSVLSSAVLLITAATVIVFFSVAMDGARVSALIGLVGWCFVIVVVACGAAEVWCGDIFGGVV